MSRRELSMGTHASPIFYFRTIAFNHSGKRIIWVNSPSKKKLKVNFNKKVKCIVFSYKNEYIKYKKLSKNNGRSYPRTNEVYTITNNDTNSNSLHAYINNIKYNNVQLHGNEIATTDLKSSVLNERVSQSSEFEHCPTYYSFKNKNLHCQNGEKTVLEPALYKNAAMPLENANFYKGTSTPKILNVLSMSTNNLKLNSLYHIFDVNSKQLYIIDSGSTLSCFKASEEDKKEPIGFLTAANGTKINIYDVQTKTVNFLLRRDYVHNFMICDVVCNILGLDFFEKYNFLKLPSYPNCLPRLLFTLIYYLILRHYLPFYI